MQIQLVACNFSNEEKLLENQLISQIGCCFYRLERTKSLTTFQEFLCNFSVAKKQFRNGSLR